MRESTLKGKVAMITGGTSAIGKAIALKLAEDGAKLVLIGRNAETGQAALDEVRAAGGEGIFVAANVLVPGDMDRVVQEALDRFGQIDICIASAGGGRYPEEGDKAWGYFHKTDPFEVAAAVSELVIGKLAPVRAVVEHMTARKTGAILFVTSEGGRFPTPGQTTVSLAAGGLMAMCKVVAKEFSRHRIRVNTLAITIVQDTPSWDVMPGSGASGSIYDRIVGKAPFGIAKPAEIADVARFLVSDEAMFITGATVSATGGVTYS